MSIPSAAPLDPPPRKAHLRRGIRNVRRAYRTFFALVILVFAGWAVSDAFRWYDLTYHAHTTVGKITKKQTIAFHAVNEYRVEYAFTIVNGTYIIEIIEEKSVPLPVYEKTAEDKPCLIVYLPENPKVEHWLFDNHAVRTHVMYLTLGHGLAALLAYVVLRLVERPLARELRLARRGVVTQGQILTIGKPRGRRAVVKITYAFQTVAGATVQGVCPLPRRFRADTLTAGMSIDVVVDPRNPRIHKPRFALDYVAFGDKSAGA